MKKWMSAVCVLMAVLFMTGCGKDNSFNPSVSSLYIEKNGEITQAIVESFAQEYYSLDEFSAMVQKEVDVYNQKLGETKITVESTEVKDSVMYLKLHYADADTYRLYNEEYLFVGSVEDALSEGLSFNMIFRDADYEGEYTAADVTENKSETVAVAKEEGVIQLEKPVKYVSSNVEILDAHTVEVMSIEAEDEYAYIIY